MLGPRLLVSCLLSVALMILEAAEAAFAASVADRPNILLILSDDQGWADVRCHGNPAIDTPTLDLLAGQGARFDRFFVSPVCAPTRASLLTGHDHLRTGTVGVTHGLEAMRSEEVTLAEVPRGSTNDQGHYRGEALEELWADLPLGPLQLDSGRQSLTIRAIEVPGPGVIELKAVLPGQVGP